MPGKSKASEMFSLRVPIALYAAARASAARCEQSLASWIVGAMWARLARDEPEEPHA